MQNGGFVNKIQGVRLSVAKIHRHVFENPGYIVNLAYVRSVVEYEVAIGKDVKIPLSKYRKKQFKEALLDYYGDQLG